ncbi:ryncolin-1-like [Oculina patagonica]
MKKQLTQVEDCINILKGNKPPVKPKNCAELYKSGEKISGVYTIDPDGSGAFDVFCDQTTAGGGWTVFQKRLDGSVNFYRGWADYKSGFGNLNGEFWLGLEKIHRLTKTKNRLRVDLEDTTGKTAYAEYDMFAFTSERTKYQLSLGTYSGTAGDSLSGHRGYPFSTKDQDNDSASSANCAVMRKAAWWYKSCHYSNLNGLYHKVKHSSYADGVNWYHWKGYHYSAKRAEMKIRPVHF